MRAAQFAIVGAALLLVGAMYARSAVPPADNTEIEDADTWGDTPDAGGWTDDAAQAVDESNPFAIMEQSNMTQSAEDANCQAFLTMIATSEGTERASDPYAVCYGYRHEIADFSDHPALTGEWPGEPLDNLGPTYAGKVSTAAGRYQIIRPTWKGCKRALGLTDFEPDSQDAAALYIVQEAGALDDVKAGRFDDAVAKCAGQWASLPGANAPGQAMRRLDDLRAAYLSAGGALA